MITEHIINSKDVYITEKHHHVLLPWAIGKQKYGDLLVFSLDHHTDTHEPFLRFAFNHEIGEANDKKVQTELKKIDIRNLGTIEKAIKNLHNDEHINTAIRANIIEKFFIISYSNHVDTPISFEEQKYLDDNFRNLPPKGIEYPSRPFSYPDADIYIPENICWVGCKAGPHNDSCMIPHFNQCLKSIFLDHKLNIMEEMNSKFIKGKRVLKDYILDIDLDYFHTLKSINPLETATFYSLINNSKFITIAKEEDFIKEWSGEYKYDENIDVNFLLDKLLSHIDNATN